MGRHADGRRRLTSTAVGLVVALAFTSFAAAGASGAPRRPVAVCATLGVGAHGPAVATLQRAVGSAPDGDFGPLTRAAVRQWQRKHHLRATGWVNGPTWRRLPVPVVLAACSEAVSGSPRADGSAATVGVHARCTTLGVGSVGPAVRVLQAAVHARADGEFGRHTQAAVHAAQRRLRLPVTRRVGPSTWAALGLTGTPACTTPATPAASTAPTTAPTPTPAPTPTAPPDAAAQATIRGQVAKLAANLPASAGTTTDPVARKVLAFAQAQTGKPYRWAATGPAAYDCSGLVLASYRAAGLTVPRVAADQYTVGAPVPLDQVHQGDLVFWASDVARPATIYHVAIYAGSGRVLDAPYTGAYVGTRALWTRDLLPVAMRPTGLLELPVSLGSTGWTVSQLQQALDRGGAHLAVDGADGPMTTAAVKAWQSAHRLPATGVVDLTTWLTLT